ncbi:MAG TPA: HlyD family efflux transporter periplasmic adaptor subunit [Candidatus Limnocylindrales bacterium]|nr:HlyD family efflux transporter periplasmic adaptor subunit [Candidatus Limnocylindrales bacterium]
MDIARPDVKRRKQRRRIIITALSVLGLVILTLGISRLKPAPPAVDKGGLIIDTVKRGEMLRQVHGNGTLAPEELLFVQAESEGRVERILVLPGAEVHADTVLLELSNPDLEAQVFDLEWQLKAAEATLRRLKVQLESDRLTQEAALEKLKTELVQASLEAQADVTLAKSGLVPEITRRRSSATAEQLANQVEAEKKRLAISQDSTEAQLSVQQAEIEKLRASLELKRKKLTALKVRAGVDGVLQQIGDTLMLQSGQRVTPGATLAKIVQPRKLKAELKVAETQAKDIELNQPAEIDTRNGIVPGHVVRIDPASFQGTVTIDVKLDGELPRGARPDLSVDGSIELERMTNVLYVGRPINGQPESTTRVFKVVDGGSQAIQAQVKFGRTSVSTISVLEGLSEGDQIITSDMAQWDAHDRVRLR